jgi:hypothetical protein
MVQQVIQATGHVDNYSQLISKLANNIGELYSGASEGDQIKWYDDFTGDTLDARYATLLEGTDAATIDAAIVSTVEGGILRCTTGDVGTGLAADMGQLVSALEWKASRGGLAYEIRLALSAITNCYGFFGFTDFLSLEAPIISAGAANTITTTATDAVGFMFDTRMSTVNWWGVGVANDVDMVSLNIGFAPVAATYARLRVEVSAAGAASFYYNGTLVGTVAGAVTPTVLLTPTLNFGKLSVAASMTFDVDYWLQAQNRQNP